MLPELCQSVTQIVWAWWRHDRIRVSPDEGRLLRIESQDVLLIGDTQVEVITRSIVKRVSGVALHFNCRTPTGSAELFVELTLDGQLQSIRWNADDEERVLSVEDLDVWSRCRML
jgi:hypothetical protein